MIPALLKPLLDSGFKAGTLNLWLVPVAVIGLFAVRGVAGFVVAYGCRGPPTGRSWRCAATMFERLLDAEPARCSAHTRPAA